MVLAIYTEVTAGPGDQLARTWPLTSLVPVKKLRPITSVMLSLLTVIYIKYSKIFILSP